MLIELLQRIAAPAGIAAVAAVIASAAMLAAVTAPVAIELTTTPSPKEPGSTYPERSAFHTLPAIVVTADAEKAGPSISTTSTSGTPT